ncbi:tetratricopeptide repeat protein [Pirellulimonas nuda]|uniref:Tetratricopeptide repeat protein n=1 Tax=Pirellulimonas nuda TaxID=2528009 RepID=A0A518DBH7_9BACT|nr:DUF5107 domain-containing protein [Pirellulimonas nuda]QDU88831.1 tetratricopeptide repeat protein [Pirellulimonas nuda]
MTTLGPSHRVTAVREVVEIPTYEVGDPDPNPMFLERRVYQGSSGAVYPFPVIEAVAHEKTLRQYQAIFLENEYLKLMILPELGGRLQMALDKTNNYHFVYYNRVIKPALVGLAGPWISGGIEFNWPQHHRPSTFHPVDADIERHDDGSVTVWCNEIDRMVGSKGMHGFTLYPGRAYLEIRGRVYNRTPMPETFLWWANPAVHVDENHQSIFPPDVNAVMDHGKRGVSGFPIATGEYYKVDYSPGTDISRYKNIPVPTSYMAYHSDFDFVGSYDHGRQAGLLHVASHHVSPGKKQWTWGHGEFGRAWDRRLTDEDGPYIELMCGVYTDNQPDFSWLAPGEEKDFSQYFMPYKGVGVIKNATIDAAVGLDVDGRRATVRVYTTAQRPGAQVELSSGEETLLLQEFDGDPRSWSEFETDLPSGVEERSLVVIVTDRNGAELVAYRSPPPADAPPEAAKPIPEPAALDSVESLYLAGMHLEQYRHATRLPEDYFREALRRDSGDLRTNIAMGRLLYRRGCYREAEGHFRTGVARATQHNSNPLDGEPLLGLGLALAAQGRFAEAADALHKSAWNAACRDAAYFELARISTREGEWVEAEGLLRQCLDGNAGRHQAVHLLVCVLYELGRHEEAERVAADELRRDPFNVGVLFERARVAGASDDVFRRRMRADDHNYTVLAADYLAAGLEDRACEVLQRFVDRESHGEPTSMLLYHLALALRLSGDATAADLVLSQAAAAPRGGFFPNTLADLAALRSAIDLRPDDAAAWCDLGNLLFSKKRYVAGMACWEKTCELDPTAAQPRRNLGLAYFNKRHDAGAAWRMLSEAHRLAPSDARVLYELDQLAKRLNHDPAGRLERLQGGAECVAARDDLLIEKITLLNQLGRHQQALEVLLSRSFHPWEGGEGKASAQYVLSLVELARRAIAVQEWDGAKTLLSRALDWPHSLGEGKLAGIQENNIHYWLGVAARGGGRESEAREWFGLASQGLSEPTSAQYYNDQPPAMVFYQGLAHQALGQGAAASARFEKLIEYGESHLDDPVTIDYFAVSLPTFVVFDADLEFENKIHCRFMRALGLLGLGVVDGAAEEFDWILAADVNHLGAITHRSMCASATLAPSRNAAANATL